jgi:TonB family protein
VPALLSESHPMRLSHVGGLLCAFVVAELATLSVRLPASADQCPVSIRALFLNSVGSTKFYQYEALLTSVDSRPYAISLAAESEAKSNGASINVPLADFTKSREAAVLFPWPSADLAGIALRTVTSVADGNVITCETPFVQLSTPSPVQTTWHFDDSASAVVPPITAISVIVMNAGLAVLVPPDYPDTAKVNGWQGSAVVGVSVGPDGTVLATWLQNSSGYDILDQVGLKNARTAKFRKPLVDGSPAAMTFLVDYVWRLQ